MNKVLEWVLSNNWAITKEAYHAIKEIVINHNVDIDPKAFHQNNDILSQIDKIRQAEKSNKNFSAIRAIKGTSVDGSYYLRTRDNVAVIPVYGPITPRASLFACLSGGRT